MNDDQLRAARRVAYLVTGFIRNNLSPAEREELNEWIAASDENMNLFAQLTDSQNIAEALQWFDTIDEEIAKRKSALITHRTRIFNIRALYIQWIAAASIIIIASIVLLRVNSSRSTPGKENITPAVTKENIVPGTKKALLITGDGKSIDLTDVANTQIQIDDNSQATNINSVLSYTHKSSEAVMHTLRIPRGGEYQLVLPDGTHVWLNAESTLTYPTSFAGGNRKVALTGEAYFEVTPDPEKFFEVQVNHQTTVRVLGTHFNINAYADTPHDRISLLEGIVQVTIKQQSKKITAGQQAMVQNDHIEVSRSNNIEASNAWVRGKFSFNKTPVLEVLQQLGRWYDVTINYNGAGGHEFTGEIFRNSSLEEVLQMLRLSTGEQYNIQGKTIEIRP